MTYEMDADAFLARLRQVGGEVERMLETVSVLEAQGA